MVDMADRQGISRAGCECRTTYATVYQRLQMGLDTHRRVAHPSRVDRRDQLVPVSSSRALKPTLIQNMKFLITWKIHEGKIQNTLSLFAQMSAAQEQSLMGEGVELIGRWHDLVRGTGAAIYEADSAEALSAYSLNWSQSMDLDISMVVDDGYRSRDWLEAECHDRLGANRGGDSLGVAKHCRRVGATTVGLEEALATYQFMRRAPLITPSPSRSRWHR